MPASAITPVIAATAVIFMFFLFIGDLYGFICIDGYGGQRIIFQKKSQSSHFFIKRCFSGRFFLQSGIRNRRA